MYENPRDPRAMKTDKRFGTFTTLKQPNPRIYHSTLLEVNDLTVILVTFLNLHKLRGPSAQNRENFINLFY